MRLKARTMGRAGAVTLAALLCYGVFEYWRLPGVSTLRDQNPRTTAWMELRKLEAEREGRSYTIRHRWKPYRSFSPMLISSVLIAEDAAFFSHDGLDYDEIQATLKDSWEKKSLTRGASTITQQLAKNLFLSPSRSPVRKLKELVLTRRLERELSKRRILELYLNLIEWGDGIFGAEEAARYYYGKSASDLEAGECALLAAVIINPIRYSPYRSTKRLVNRYHMLLDKLAAVGKVDPSQLASARAEGVRLRTGQVFPPSP